MFPRGFLPTRSEDGWCRADVAAGSPGGEGTAVYRIARAKWRPQQGYSCGDSERWSSLAATSVSPLPP